MRIRRLSAGQYMCTTKGGTRRPGCGYSTYLPNSLGNTVPLNYPTPCPPRAQWTIDHGRGLRCATLTVVYLSTNVVSAHTRLSQTDDIFNNRQSRTLWPPPPRQEPENLDDT